LIDQDGAQGKLERRLCVAVPKSPCGVLSAEHLNPIRIETIKLCLANRADGSTSHAQPNEASNPICGSSHTATRFSNRCRRRRASRPTAYRLIKSCRQSTWRQFATRADCDFMWQAILAA